MNMLSRIVPLGFRFSPTEEELISEYLIRKVKGESLPCEGVIIERDIYGKAPWDVFTVENPWHTFKINKDKWEFVIYVFTKLKKIGRKKRIVRKAGCGTWNAQSGIEKIYNEQKEHIGFKKMLVFEANVKKDDDFIIMPPGHWIMQEYSLGGVSLDGGLEDDDYVVCKIKRDDSKSLKRATKHEDGHGGVTDHDLGCLSKTSHAVSKEENLTHKKMRYDVSTPENFDQSITIIGHQLLPTQQSQCSSPDNRSFEATATQDQHLPPHEIGLFDPPKFTMNSTYTIEEDPIDQSTYTIEDPIDQSFFDNIYLELMHKIIYEEH